ncbi:Mu homology domain-containing protein [Syncephalis plumigaleata]|nr:Mu homology domain-containing protein [Syncephalis plumigaleata]
MDSLYILDSARNVIIEKPLRGVVDRSVVDHFRELVDQQEGGIVEVPPVLRSQRHTFVHTLRDGLTYLTIVDRELSPLLALTFLQHISDIFHDYFGEVTDVIIKDNFVTVYMLLEEMSDNGFPLMTESNALKEMIPPPSVYQRVMNTVASVTNVTETSLSGNISSLPWRRADVRYTNNEVYFDIIEEMEVIVDSKGPVVLAEIYGAIQCNCRLSGMPDLSLSLSNPALLNDASFHPCIRYPMFESDRIISFVPPDGQFKLLQYRLSYALPLPIAISPKLRINKDTESRLEVSLLARQTGGKPVEDTRLMVPLPSHASNIHVSANYGHARCEPSSKIIYWDAGNISDKERVPQLTATFNCPENTRRSGYTAQLEFRIDGYAASGLRINGLALHGESYNHFKGLRSMTKSGRYHIRF